MYIVSFYSYKGGVGRSMALVNVGAELARAGRRVLLVDFDLEAPCLTSFNLSTSPASSGRGIVDFVTDYLQTGQAPSIADYLIESESIPGAGQLWIMPAGAVDDRYPLRLHTINWPDLYAQHEGYLLMEDLKEQWRTHLDPDYVLIDSRTGHSEVMGICTRQLPDAVCLVFIPNRQNLDGLQRVVAQIRKQKTNSEGREIRLHFVVSNVPEDDDEHGTLHRNKTMFQERLGIGQFDATLHHHSNMAILDQEVFTLTRPNTSLADEYRALVDVIRKRNLGDPGPAVSYLRRLTRDLTERANPLEAEATEQTLREIAQHNSTNGEVLFWLARARRQLGSSQEALILIDRSLELGYRRPEVFLERASLRLRERDADRLNLATDDFLQALELSKKQPTFQDVWFAVRSLAALEYSNASELAEKPAVRALRPGDQLNLTGGLDGSNSDCAMAYHILRNLPRRGLLNQEQQILWRTRLSLACIRLRRFDEAIELLLPGIRQVELIKQADVFNTAMATWGRDGRPPQDLFVQTLAMHESGSHHVRDANYHQCLAIAAWIDGAIDLSKNFAKQARTLASQEPSLQFSAWRYLRISPVAFVDDLDEMQSLLDGPPALPPFMQSNERGQPRARA